MSDHHTVVIVVVIFSTEYLIRFRVADRGSVSEFAGYATARFRVIQRLFCESLGNHERLLYLPVRLRVDSGVCCKVKSGINMFVFIRVEFLTLPPSEA